VSKKLVTAKGVLTDADVAEFERHMRVWQILLNLNDWRLELSRKPASKSNLAELVRCELQHRLASVRINRDWGHENEITPLKKARTALHEDLHVLLRELLEFTADPRANEEDKEAAEHRVIVTLVNVLLPDEPMRALMKTLGVK
jgi:uncharacterized protein YdcH (DUF465 family)